MPGTLLQVIRWDLGSKVMKLPPKFPPIYDCLPSSLYRSEGSARKSTSKMSNLKEFLGNHVQR